MGSFGEPTDSLIKRALIDRSLGYKLTMEQRMLIEMRYGEWIGGRDLALSVSHRFGGYLFTLKEKGVRWEKRLDPDRPHGADWWQYRLVHVNDEPRLF